MPEPVSQMSDTTLSSWLMTLYRKMANIQQAIRLGHRKAEEASAEYVRLQNWAQEAVTEWRRRQGDPDPERPIWRPDWLVEVTNA